MANDAPFETPRTEPPTPLPPAVSMGIQAFKVAGLPLLFVDAVAVLVWRDLALLSFLARAVLFMATGIYSTMALWFGLVYLATGEGLHATLRLLLVTVTSLGLCLLLYVPWLAYFWLTAG